MAVSQDLRYAVRTLLKSPAFTAIVVLTLGLGIGANTAIFSLTDQVLLRLLPVRSPERLVVLDGPGAFQGRTFNNGTFSYPMYRDFRDQNTVFDGVLARFPAPLTLITNGQAERVDGEIVTGNYFDVLGVRAHIGRTFTQDDDRTPGGHPVVMLTHSYWVRRFDRNPAVLNSSVTLNGQPMTVVGVSSPGFYGIVVGESPDVFVPVTMKAQMTPTWDDLQNRRSRWLTIMARLKPGVSAEQAESAMNVIYRQINEQELKDVAEPVAELPRALRQQAPVPAPGPEGALRSAPAVFDADPGADGHGRSRPADRVRERRQPAARARRRAPEGSGDSPRARREPRRDRAAAADRKPRARGRGRRRRAGVRVVDRRAAAEDAALRRRRADAVGVARRARHRSSPSAGRS